MFSRQFKSTCESFATLMGSTVPEWFIQYLIQTRSKIKPKTNRNSIQIKAWKGHSLAEIEAHLHALHMSPAGILFNSLLSAETGYIMAHTCGWSDCFYPGTIEIQFPGIAFIKNDFVKHVEQQKQQLGIAA